MRAISQDVLGGPEVLKVLDLPVPEPGPSQVLIQVRAAGLNPTDWAHRAHKIFLPDPPFTLGWDVSGVVAATGFGVTLFKPGDEVFGMLPYPYGVGSHAEYVIGPTRAFTRKPANLSHVEAGALPVVALTAWQAFVDTARVQPGHRVLIHAAAGGVGHVAVQVAKSLGAHVIGTASAGNHDMLRDLGADELIDYRTTDFTEVVHDVDVVLDAVGGDYPERSLLTLRPGGLLISIRRQSAGVAGQARGQGKRGELLLVEYDHAGMAAIGNLAADGRLRPVIAGTFSLEQAAKAHEIGDSGHVAGKLVYVMEP